MDTILFNKIVELFDSSFDFRFGQEQTPAMLKDTFVVNVGIFCHNLLSENDASAKMKFAKITLKYSEFCENDTVLKYLTTELKRIISNTEARQFSTKQDEIQNLTILHEKRIKQIREMFGIHETPSPNTH